MTSKLVVNTIESDTGISSVSFASSISMSSTSKFFFSAAGIDIGADTNINRPASGVLGFNISGNEKVRITSAGNVCVGGHTAALSTYNSTQPRLSIYKSSGSGGYLELGGNLPHNSHSSGTILFINNDNSEATSNNANGKILAMQRVENVTSDTNAGDDMGGDLVFMTRPEAGTLGERLRIDSNGMIGFGGVTPKTQNTFDAIEFGKTGFLGSQTAARTVAVSYTHLTLPTKA